MARRLLSATEHHSAAEREKRQEDGGEDEAICPRPAAADTITGRTAHNVLLFRRRERAHFYRVCIPCACLRGTHCFMKGIAVDTSQSLHRQGGGGEMNYSTSRHCSSPTSCRVLWGGEASRRQQAAPPRKAAVTTAPGWSIRGTLIFQRTGHHFREQQ